MTRARLKLSWIASAAAATAVYVATANSTLPGAVLLVWGWAVASDYHGVAGRLHRQKGGFLFRRGASMLELKLLFAGVGVIGAVLLFTGVQAI